MSAFKNLLGERFERLEVIERDETQRETYWVCRCDCGESKSVRAGNLLAGQVRSCGCLQREAASGPDMMGQRFARLVVVGRLASRGGSSRWLCRCDCGEERAVAGSNLRNGNSKSCGCLRVDKAKANRTHGMAKTLPHKCWVSIKQRCFNPANPSYRNYGGRGITMCDEWAASFEAFYAYVGDCPGPGLSLDRINNDGNYEPGNVRWANGSTQMLNRRAVPRTTRTQLAEAVARAEAAEAEIERLRGAM